MCYIFFFFFFLLRKIALPYPHKCLVWFCGAKASTDESFNKDFSCREVTPLSANIRACADIVDESDCLETLHYIFGCNGSNIVYFFYHYGRVTGQKLEGT